MAEKWILAKTILILKAHRRTYRKRKLIGILTSLKVSKSQKARKRVYYKISTKHSFRTY